MLTKPCLQCGKTITKPQTESLRSWENRRKYCSKDCLGKANGLLGNWKKSSFTKERHYVPPTAIKKGQHLSPTTQFKKGHTKTEAWYRKMGQHVPWNKGKKWSDEARVKMSISQLARDKTNQPRGDKHPAWKGGITPLRTRIYFSPQYREWRSTVFVRDNYTCVSCNSHGDTLNVDHIKPFALIVKENNILTFEQALECLELWDISNGRTLCVPCHRNTDTYGVRK